MLIKKTYNPVAGSFEITDSDLAYAKLLRVTRTGDNHNIIDYETLTWSDEVSNFEVAFGRSSGYMLFNHERPFETGEFVNVIFDR